MFWMDILKVSLICLSTMKKADLYPFQMVAYNRGLDFYLLVPTFILVENNSSTPVWDQLFLLQCHLNVVSAEGGQGIWLHLLKEFLIKFLRVVATWDILSSELGMFAIFMAFGVLIEFLKRSWEGYFPQLSWSHKVKEDWLLTACFLTLPSVFQWPNLIRKILPFW